RSRRAFGRLVRRLGANGQGLETSVSLPDNGNAVAPVGATEQFTNAGGTVLDALKPLATSMNQADLPILSVFNLPVNLPDPDFDFLTDMSISFSLYHSHMNEVEIDLVAPDGIVFILVDNHTNSNHSTNPLSGLNDVFNLGVVTNNPNFL